MQERVRTLKKASREGVDEFFTVSNLNTAAFLQIVIYLFWPINLEQNDTKLQKTAPFVPNKIRFQRIRVRRRVRAFAFDRDAVLAEQLRWPNFCLVDASEVVTHRRDKGDALIAEFTLEEFGLDSSSRVLRDPVALE